MIPTDRFPARMGDRLPHSGPAIHGPYESMELRAMRLLPWIVMATFALLWFIGEVL